jgi:ATP-dependent helicase/nuclease subunit A
MAFERNSVPSLTGFLVWMETDDLEIKRQIDTASDQIRIMTVHGAKGLEAPIVVLPECETRKASNADQILQLGDRGVWCPRKDQRPDMLEDVISHNRLRQDEESLRLLYVALTRAEKWLIVAGSGEVDDKNGTDWHSRVSAAAVGGTELDTPFGNGKRIEHGDWNSFKITAEPTAHRGSVELEPCLTLAAKRPSDQSNKFAPSSVEGQKVLPGEGLAEADALAYGNLVHSLLEHLPAKATPLWETVFEEDVDRFGLSEELSKRAFLEAETVLKQTSLSHIFSDDSLAEVQIIAQAGPRQLVGVIDRLLIRDDHVVAVDFKTNAVVPSTAEDVPVGLIKQMAAYADALGQIYPKHRIDMAILWTAEPRLMSLPHDIVRHWVKDARYLDDLRIEP